MLVALCRVLGAGLLVAAVAGLRRSRLPGGASRPAVEATPATASGAAGLAFGLEAWAALLAAGAPMSQAVTAAGNCCDGAAAAALRAVGDALRSGQTSEEAWTAAVEGLELPALALAGQACVRSERDGLPLAPVLRRLAADERTAAASRGVVAARRAGVLAVLPLGLCTLPAYVLLSVAPTVIGLVRHVH